MKEYKVLHYFFKDALVVFEECPKALLGAMGTRSENTMV
jgi:hypothetical protein